MLVCSKTWFKEEDISKSAIQIEPKDKAISANVCNQCGICIGVCQVEAISRQKNGTVVINPKICMECLTCVGFCPTLSMRTHKDQNHPFKCRACGACIKACPTGALDWQEIETPIIPPGEPR